jgi:hypothetical protein
LAVVLQRLESKEELLSALNNPNPGADFIKNWHKKMAECQLSELKIQRELMHLRESETMAMKELELTSKRASSLEEELVALQVRNTATKWKK